MSEQSSAPGQSSDQESSVNPASDSADSPNPGFGWIPYAEQINGRFAMVGFISLLILELFTRQDFFTWIGLR